MVWLTHFISLFLFIFMNNLTISNWAILLNSEFSYSSSWVIYLNVLIREWIEIKSKSLRRALYVVWLGLMTILIYGIVNYVNLYVWSQNSWGFSLLVWVIIVIAKWPLWSLEANSFLLIWQTLSFLDGIGFMQEEFLKMFILEFFFLISEVGSEISFAEGAQGSAYKVLTLLWRSCGWALDHSFGPLEYAVRVEEVMTLTHAHFVILFEVK